MRSYLFLMFELTDVLRKHDDTEFIVLLNNLRV